MSTNTDTVNRYLEGFRINDHAQILSCLTDDIDWTVFGVYRLHGKSEYDAASEGPGWVAPPLLDVIRIVEQDDVIMAEIHGTVRDASGAVTRLSMAEVFVMQDGRIRERRAWVIPLRENDYR